MLHSLLDLFRHRPIGKPEDLRAFEEAQTRLHETTKTVARETDVLGAVVRKLKGPAPARKKRTAA